MRALRAQSALTATAVLAVAALPAGAPASDAWRPLAPRPLARDAPSVEAWPLIDRGRAVIVTVRTPRVAHYGRPRIARHPVAGGRIGRPRAVHALARGDTVQVSAASSRELVMLVGRRRSGGSLSALSVPASGAPVRTPLAARRAPAETIDVAVADDGTAVATWAACARGRYRIQAAVRTPGARRFGPARRIARMPLLAGPGESAAEACSTGVPPALTAVAARGGRVGVLWSDAGTDEQTPLRVRAAPRRGAFAPARAVTGELDPDAPRAAALDPAGTLHVAWEHAQDVPAPTCLHALSLALGDPGPAPAAQQLGCGEPPTEGYPVGRGEIALVAGDDGVATVAWARDALRQRTVLAATRPAGGAFGALQSLLTARAFDHQLALLALPGGGAALAFSDSPTPVNPRRPRVFVTHRPSATEPFSTVRRRSRRVRAAFSVRLARGSGRALLAIWMESGRGLPPRLAGARFAARG